MSKLIGCIRSLFVTKRNPERVVAIDIMGSQVFLMTDEVLRPTDSKRIGAVKMVFPDKTDQMIRVFGFLGDLKDYYIRVEFEKQLRAVCEKPEVLKKLFDYSSTEPVFAKRFCPSQILGETGWRSRSAKFPRSYPSRATH